MSLAIEGAESSLIPKRFFEITRVGPVGVELLLAEKSAYDGSWGKGGARKKRKVLAIEKAIPATSDHFRILITLKALKNMNNFSNINLITL